MNGADVNGCGCCGRDVDLTALWGDTCALHVTTDWPPWERPWFAQHGVPCPFAEVPA